MRRNVVKNKIKYRQGAITLVSCLEFMDSEKIQTTYIKPYGV